MKQDRLLSLYLRENVENIFLTKRQFFAIHVTMSAEKLYCSNKKFKVLLVQKTILPKKRLVDGIITIIHS